MVLIDITSGVLALWHAMTDRHVIPTLPLFEGAPMPVLQSIQPVLDLSAAVFQAYPGPGLTEKRRSIPAVTQGPRRPASALAAEEAASCHGGPAAVIRPEEEGTASLAFMDKALAKACCTAVMLQTVMATETWSQHIAQDPLATSFLTPGLPSAVLEIVGSPAAQQLTLAMLVLHVGKVVYSKARAAASFQDLKDLKARQQRPGGNRCMDVPGPAGQQSPQSGYRQLASALGPVGEAALLLTSISMPPTPISALLGLACHCTAKATVDARKMAGGLLSRLLNSSPAEQAEVLPHDVVKPLAMTLLDMSLLAIDICEGRLAARLLQSVLILPGRGPSLQHTTILPQCRC